MVSRAAYPGDLGAALREFREGRRRDPRWTRANWGHHAFLTQAFASIAQTLERSGVDPWAGDVVLGVGPNGARFLDYLRRSGEPGPSLQAADVAPDGTLPAPDASASAVVLSLVLSELPSPLARAHVARECCRALRPDGLIVCWDARLPNPRNRSVGSVGRREIARLFPDGRIDSASLTLVPPLARRLGSTAPFVYSAFESLPALRSHLLTTIRMHELAATVSGR
jgi:SAM-dependent methyltransferase